MLYLIIGLIILACFLLWVVILIQNPKGGGLSSQFGGSSVTNIIGAKQSVDVVEKATWYVGIAIIVLVVLSSYITAPREAEVGPGINADGSIPTQTIAPAQDDAAQDPPIDVPQGTDADNPDAGNDAP